MKCYVVCVDEGSGYYMAFSDSSEMRGWGRSPEMAALELLKQNNCVEIVVIEKGK